MRRLVLLCIITLNLSAPAFSKESSPREPKRKTETSNPDDKKSDETQSYPYNLPSWISAQPPAQVINIFTAKHAGEKSECPEPKDGKEWASIAWCHGLEWIDAERVIAVFTVILGFATWALWRSTDRLVRGAEETAERQLRAYISIRVIRPLNIKAPVNFGVVYNIWNIGSTPGTVINLSRRIDIYRYPLPDDFVLPEGDTCGHGNVIGANDPSVVGKMHADRLFAGQEWEAVFAKKPRARIYFHGFICYKDVFGKDRKTEFCYSFIASSLTAHECTWETTDRRNSFT